MVTWAWTCLPLEDAEAGLRASSELPGCRLPSCHPG